jgi:peptidoglycan/xylan/chitin deacetylase (PgdA/CDA1 family)
MSAPAISKREKVARLAGWAGLTSVLERVSRRSCLAALTYHRIGTAEECRYDRGVFEATADQLYEQVRYLKTRFHIASLSEALAWVKARQPGSHTHILLTFDDGYIDNYQTAFPILKSLGVPGTFFLTTSLVGTDLLPWWDRIAYLLRHTKRQQIELTYPERYSAKLGEDTREQIIAGVLSLFKTPAMNNPQRFLEGVERTCDLKAPKRAEQRLFLDWGEAATMLSGGMSVGSHTHTHQVLAKLTDVEQIEEMHRSRTVLQERLSIEAEAVAYPVGSARALNPSSEVAAKEAGYKLGFRNDGGVNLGADRSPYQLHRIPMACDVAMPLFRFRTAVAVSMNRRF